MTGESSRNGRGEVSKLLRALATRVRGLRHAKGWTRAALAERSGLSLRFLARIEGGEGNVSLLSLDSLAAALDTSPAELLRQDAERSRVVALVGLRGAGKSTVGPILAQRLAAPFIEMDALIQEAAGLPLDQIFELHGERYYRRLERETLGKVLSEERPIVLATAGGVVNEPSSWEMLTSRATVVWLKARPEDHFRRVILQGDRRPMAQRPDALADLRAMLAARERIYAQAHLTVDTTGTTPRRVAARVAEALGVAPARRSAPRRPALRPRMRRGDP